MDELERQEQLLRQAMQELQESSTVTADTFNKLSRETNSFSKSIEKAEESIDRFWRSGLGKATKAAGDLVSGFTKGAQAARQNRESFESLNPVIEGAAAALSAIPIVGDALGRTLSTVGTFVTSELQRSVEAFQTLGSVGAVGADGVSGLRKSAEEAGLAFEQLAKITQANAQGLAFATGSTAEGARAISEITSAAEPFRSQLLAMGFGINEQSEIFADFLEINRRLGRAQTRDYRSLATGAADYAKQLNLLSRLTGESADAMKAELESQQSNVMFRAALRGLAPDIQEGAQNIAAVLGRAGPTFQQGVQDMFGGAMGTEAAQAVFRATGGQARDIIDAFKNRLITQEEALARFRDAAERQRETVGNEFFAVAGNLNHAFSQVGIEMFNLADNAALTREALARTGAEALKTAQAQDEPTRQMIDAQLALQRFATEADKFVNDQVFPNATGVVKSLTDSLAGLADTINDVASGNFGGPETNVRGRRASGGPVIGGEPYLVGELGPEVVIPDTDGTVISNDNLNNLVSAAQQTKTLTNQQIEARYATLQKALGETLSLAEGFKSAFLPGIGEVAQYNAGGTEIIEVKGLDGVVETFKQFTAGNLTGRQYTTGEQTYASGTYNIGDMQASTGYFPTTGPRSFYESMLAGVANPMTDASFQQRVATGSESYEMKEIPLNREALTLLTELKNTMADVATNTRTGADTNKKLLRASTG